MTIWLDPTPVDIPDSFSTLGLHPLAAETLVRRGISELSAAKAFLDPEEYTPTDAWDLPDLRIAVERIEHAIRTGESICVWGDFDVDGQTSTALLVQTLRALKADVLWHIPVRATESHGIKIPYLKEIIDNGAQLILTCDTGVGENEAIDYANSRGVDVVVTDHHDLPETLPNALAIVDPKRLPVGHPLSTLPGVGVAYKLAEKLLSSKGFSPSATEVATTDLLDLVALGITADVADLYGDARYLLQCGLIELRQTKRIGLQTLYELAGIYPLTVNEGDIGFGIAPRMNAIGRLGDANIMVDFLTTENPSQARVIATQLEGLNTQRRLLTSQVYQAAESQLSNDPKLKETAALVLAQKDWPAGVIGITASRLGERYHKPVILLSIGEDGQARGSARSVAGIHITQAIAAQKDILHGFGGHPMAAGMALDAEKIPAFRRRISQTINASLGEEAPPEGTLQIDAWMAMNELSLELSATLSKLAPFGPRNPTLTLACRDLEISSVAKMGRNKEHLRLTVKDRQENFQSILWWNAAYEELPSEGSRFDLAFKMRTGEYQGQPQLTLEMVDFRITEEVRKEERGKKVEVIRLKVEGWKVESGGAQVFVEGKSEIKGKNRYELGESSALAIYTSPPGSSELRDIIERVKPTTIYLIGIDPPAITPQGFLSHLAGLVKYALAKKEGQTRISTLAAVTAQREATIRLGLEWLAAGGQVEVEVEGDEVMLSQTSEIRPQTSENSGKYAQAELFLAIKGLLAETVAYRKHFHVSEPDWVV
ncbi:MAG: single-stranded-DNA-specific exonuclease RecJ [Anaerolineales bacterium]|uniref:Single-stranded-DNA-specific exonuclease RecJ n=1 Tax=Candidatus Desulfolinea nitratireducens TaxID=2841698 RepID=A0A8J6NKK8_9CHLR|nr:single-stranded-DNA-specific exonuclease RecJ [Candidatus Desulfolinea nitratireducens]MBL6961795.1 single-stranded-DNA-specific exonuclease RecJ [Anaerolineales bacterium]